MPGSNGIDQGQANGHSKSPEQIQLEIERTRSAITDDLLALSEKFSPAQLRASAREVMHEAREEVQDLLREAKDTAIGSLRGAKDRALATLGDRLGELGAHARHAGALTGEFAAQHALALALLGLGAGWLLLTRRSALRLTRGRRAELPGTYADLPTGEELEPEARSGAVRAVATRATQAVDRARERVRSSAEHFSEHAAELRERTTELGERSARSLRHVAGQGRALASDPRVAAVALTVAAGIGVGLLWPMARRQRTSAGHARSRVWEETAAPDFR